MQYFATTQKQQQQQQKQQHQDQQRHLFNMTPRIITYFLCGMRHPTTGLSEDDLSRLTGSSSSTASSGNHGSVAATAGPDASSSSSSSSASSAASTAANTPAHLKEAGAGIINNDDKTALNLQKSSPRTKKAHIDKNSHTNAHAHTHESTTRFSSTYLPEFINPLEWQKSRKRKERLDSSSSATQDRKLQRSNSEELLPQETAAAPDTVACEGLIAENAIKAALKGGASNDVIRRVSSEDFKRTASFAAYEQELLQETAAALEEKIDKEKRAHVSTETSSSAAVNENDASLANRQSQQNESLPPAYSEAKAMTRHATRYETSPARSQRHSPVRGGGVSSGNGKHRDSDDSDVEHERRRSSERFSKTRAPPGRKASGVTKKSASSRRSAGSGNEENVYKYDLSALKYERRGFIPKKGSNSGGSGSTDKSSAGDATVVATAANDHNDNNLIDFHQSQQREKNSELPQNSGDVNVSTPTSTKASSSTQNSVPLTSAQEALPWDRSAGSADQTEPVLSRRYGAIRHHPVDSIDIDTAAKLSKLMPYPQQFHKPSAAVAQLMLGDDDMDCLATPINTFRAFSSLENLRTRDVMQQVIPAMMSFQSPEERLKQVNKRLTAMKKKLAQLEEAYETRMGYRPSQAERLNDKYMKNILAELSKLRKERHELKSDPMGALGLKVSGGMDATKKLEKIKATLSEIEQNLTDKREDANRSETLDELTPDQLVQEKTAVQHGLLYFESMYGRPSSKDERDVARPLYDRYRQLKRLVSRSVLLSGSVIAGAPELPTILEHEAMVFESLPQIYSSNNSTETTNSPSESVAPTVGSSDDSTTTTTAATQESASSAPAPDASENISALNIEQLWEQLDKTREEKKLLKRTIREFETVFEEQNGRKMLKSDRKTIEETYAQYKEKKAKTRLLQALIKKHISR